MRVRFHLLPTLALAGGCALAAALPGSPVAASGLPALRPALALQAQQEFVGLGLQIKPDENQRGARVAGVVDSASAEVKAAIKKDDLITHVDGKAIQGLPLDEVVQLIRGPEGSTVKLTLEREGEKKPIEVALKRTRIKAG